MGRALQIRPAKVLETVTRELEFAMMQRYQRPVPPWFDALHRIPPAEKMARTVPVRHTNRDERLMKGPRRTFIPQKIKFPEDNLRREFYKHHPWELARPRIVAESDGRDAERLRWGRGLQQPGMSLSGESVVQRQLWLMKHGRRLREKTYAPDEPYNPRDVANQLYGAKRRISKDEAYDLARKEFYALRHREQVEQRIAHEEALYVGAYFGKLRLDVSLGLEDRVHEEWLAWAEKELLAIEATTKVDGVPQPPPPSPQQQAAAAGDRAAAVAAAGTPESAPKPKTGGPALGQLRNPSMGV